MKKYLTLLFFGLLSFSLCNAQSSEKIKGNRNVTKLQTNIESYHTIVLDEDFEIEIIYDTNPYVEIETDENLHEFIEFQVIDSVLTFNKTIKITSKKKLNIKVTYNKALQHIETTDKAEILSLTTMDLKHATVKTSGSSKAGLTIKTDDFYFEGLDKSKTKLNLTADSTKVILNGNSKLETLIYSPILEADLYQRSDAIIEGNCDDLVLRIDNNAQFRGKNFTVKTCNLSSEIAGNTTLEVTDIITIEASGTSAINIYNNPQIIVNRLNDTSKIQKKIK